jgi:hypothetical protein
MNRDPLTGAMLWLAVGLICAAVPLGCFGYALFLTVMP